MPAPLFNIIRFDIGMNSKGADLAQCGDIAVRSARGSAAHKLARQLVDSGHRDCNIEAYNATGMLCYTVRSLHGFAQWTIAENPRPHRIPYREVEFGNSDI